ncbi:TetR/AcrR family transcriptional regulator [Xylophilus sp. GW821-FHT01B05]
MAELRPTFTTMDARDNILEAALAVFAHSGFSGTTMRDIAQQAGVSPGLIHHHFKDKESLWNMVGERITDDFAASTGDFLAEPLEIDETTVPKLVANYMQYWKTHPSALRFQLWRVLGAPDAERKARSERLNRTYVPVFSKAQQAGFVRRDIPAGQAMFTTGGLIQFWLHSRLEANDAIAAGGETPPDDETFLQYVLSLILVRKHI